MTETVEMTRCYFQLREKQTNQTTVLASDISRHLHSRQYLGKVLIICESPFSLLRVTRKQWLKLARTIQRQRSSTLNADKILRFTYTITHMQHMQFTAKSPLRQPDGHVFFSPASELEHIPLNCFTVYLTEVISPEVLTRIITHLPEAALVVDYANNDLTPFHLQPKSLLEKEVQQQWEAVAAFFERKQINIFKLADFDLEHADTIDDTLDTLLGASHEFLRIATHFQHTLELAHPVRIDKQTQGRYNALTLLAYRVQALTPGALSEYMLRTYHEENTFFLHDIVTDLIPENESLVETILRHHAAGRSRLAEALQTSFERLHLSR